MYFSQGCLRVATALAGYLVRGVYAGPGASMQACIYSPIVPMNSTTVQFTAGAGTDACMNNRGSSNSITVDRMGVICASIGYVEAKTSSSCSGWFECDFCASDESHWGLSWKTPDSSFSGSTNSRWHRDSKISLHGQTANTFVCGSSSRCTQTSTGWSGTGSLWIIFEPQTIHSLNTSEEEIEKHLKLLTQENDDL